MRQNLLAGILVAVNLLLAASCSNDDLETDKSISQAQVTFSLGLDNGMKTRAISDGSGINQLFFAIFDKEGNIVESSDRDGAEFPFTTSTFLVKGEEYTAVFWAQNKLCDAYSLSDDMRTIYVNYTNASNNDETRDAFFKSEKFTVNGDISLNVVLKRPFSQLNVGITAQEWDKLMVQNVEIKNSEVQIKQAATALNLIDGSVSGAEDIVFKAAPVPTESLKVDIDCNGETEEYRYLSMCYFLAYDETDGSAKTTLNDLKFIFQSDKETLILEEGLDNAPVQRNHRTNIIAAGGIFVGDVSIKVLLDVLYDGEHTYTDNKVWENYNGIYTEEALAGKTIEITSDWHIRNGYIIEPMPEYWTADSKPIYTKEYTIDGKNNKIIFEPYSYSYVTKNAFAAADSKLVTIKNISFEGEHFGIYGGVYGGVPGRIAYNTLLENVKIIDNGIYCYNSAGNTPMSAFSNMGTATLDNCTITGTYWVGAKDSNPNAGNSISYYGGVYDIFIPNNVTCNIKNSTIGSIFVHNHGKLTVMESSKVGKIIARPLVNGQITIQNNAEITLMDIDQYSNSYPPKVNIEAGATIGTLQLNSIKKSKVSINASANIGKIIWNGVEYTSITDFNAAS